MKRYKLTQSEAERIQDLVAEELYGTDGRRWPTMIGCGVRVDESGNEPVVFVSFIKGTQPPIEEFPIRVKGVKIDMRICNRLPTG